MSEGPVDRWATAGIISDEQRDAIEAYEREHPRRPSVLLSELLVYAGMAVLVAGLSPVVSSMAVPGRAVLLATLAGAAGAAGAALFRADGDSLDRAASVLWFFSVLFLAGLGAALSGSGSRGAARPLLFSGVPAFAFAAFYWWWARRGAQLIALYASALLVIFGTANALVSLSATSGGLLLAVIGALGLAASTTELVRPTHVAHQLFGFSLTLGFLIPAIGEGGTWAEVLAFMAAAFLLWLSVRERSPELLFTGALSLWVVTMHSVTQHTMGGGDAPWTVLILGAVLIGGAVRVARSRFIAER